MDEVVQFNVFQSDDEVVLFNERKRQSNTAWNTVPINRVIRVTVALVGRKIHQQREEKAKK